MLFNSLNFLLFFPVVCLAYFAIPARLVRVRNGMLLAASYYFYMNWHAEYALLLLATTVVTYVAAIGVERGGNAQRRRIWFASGCVLALAGLFVFKYSGFVADNVEQLLSALGIGIALPDFALLLPVGISFFTFQALGYLIDVHRGTTKAETDFMTFALFLSFFPQLVAGPIERSSNLLPQFRERHTVDYKRVMAGVEMMVWGYFLKLALADRCAIYVDAVYNAQTIQSGIAYTVASVLFTFQIYGDFAGYSLIAIGASRVLGFRLMDNFRAPYLSASLGEFWQRWHISLSTWFRDYVYIPLGGNRRGRLRCYLNLLVTFTVSGIWHGANWTFAAWGVLHGTGLCIEKALGIAKKSYKGIRRMVHVALTFVAVDLLWIFFRADSIDMAFTIIGRMLTNFDVPYIPLTVLVLSAFAIAVVLTKEIAEERGIKLFATTRRNAVVRHAMTSVTIAYIILFGVLGGDQFIYFQF